MALLSPRLLASAVLGALCLILAACGPRMTEARLLLDDVAAGNGPSALKAREPEPTVSAVQWQIEGRRGLGYLYLPQGTPPRGRIVLVPGLVSAGIDDPRLGAFARSLARARFAVITPDVASFRSLRISPEDTRVIADAGLALAARGLGPATGAGHVGFAALSYAVGPVLLAARLPELAPKTAFVFSIGGYHDMVSTVTYVTTGAYRQSPGGPWRYGTPNPFGVWVFARINAGRLNDPGERTTLEALASRRMADPAAPVDDLVAKLGAEGRAVYALLSNREPDRVPALIAALPEGLRSDLEALSLAGQDLSPITADVLLVHGRDDPLIPSSESRALNRALRSGHLYIVDHLSHVEFTGRPTLTDQVTLLRAATRLLAIRDRFADASP